jgi:DNA-binding MarR family transcriptional regulator
MSNDHDREAITSAELSNRLFFRLYQCANLLHKTGTKALETYGITTQQWAVVGALSRSSVVNGMTVNELAQFLRVSRQNLSGVITRLEALGLVERVKDENDQRSRRIRLSEAGWPLWTDKMAPMIADYYSRALDGFSVNDRISAIHLLNKLFNNFKALDTPDAGD